MSANQLQLKEYQTASLDALTAWLTDAGSTGDADMAFYKATRIAYQPVDGLPGVPYACIRVPTGGGKTLIAAHSIARAADAYLKTDTPCAIWLAPSSAILDQTVRALKNVNHPYAQAVAERFGMNVRVMTLAEALYAGRADYDGGATIIVSTIQSFRQEETDQLNVYKANGQLMNHFSGLNPALRAKLELGPSGQPIYSLANALKLRRPMVIVDEAHNNRTPLSFVTLARLDPSLIIEFTATPAADSNILHHVSAAELKDAQMIKLPIILRGDPDWKETLRQAKAELEELAEAANAEEVATREQLRPVMLIQAQAARGAAPVTPDVVKQALLDDFAVTEAEIKIATGSNWELDGIDLSKRDEPTRFIITVQALREGWDCPNAYVLCSLAEQQSSTAVEQMLGRVMRLPGAKLKRDSRLNQAYAFATTSSFRSTAEALAEGLVANGFNRIEARALIRQPESLPGLYAPPEIVSEPIDVDCDLRPIAQAVAAVTGGRIRLDPETRRFSATGFSKTDISHLQLAVPAILADKLNDFIAQLEQAPKPAVPAPMAGFSVPHLCVRKGDQLEIFDQSHYLDRPWALESCDAKAMVERFAPPNVDNREAVIDVTKDTGQIDFNMIERLQNELALAVDEREWPYPKLVQWLDRRLASAKGSDVTQGSAQAFIKAGLNALMADGTYALDDLRRWRFRLIDPFVRLITEYRDQRATEAYETTLFGEMLKFECSPDLSVVFDPAQYHPIKPLDRIGAFTKHIRPDLVGDMNDEEVKCADAIDKHPKVGVWVRNIEIPSHFRLQLVPHYFYPDFVAKLTDGRILVVEYKGKGTEGPADRTDLKEAAGLKWARTSGNLFVMAKDKDYAAIDRTIK